MKKHTNKILLIALMALLAGFVLTKVFRSPALESNLDSDLFAIDTAEISSFKLQRPGKPQIILTKKSSTWTVVEDEKDATAEAYAVDNLLRTLSDLKPERIVSRKQEKWNTYQVDDSASIHLTAYDSDQEELINWHVGKESQAMTYVRPGDESEVYAFEGNLRNRIDKDFNAWRDKTFLQTNKASINKLTFYYPADSGFVLEKKDNIWMLGGEKADSVKVDRYLGKLQSKDLSEFVDNFVPSQGEDVRLSVEGNSMEPVVIRAWRSPADKWVLTSSFQEGVYFSGDSFADELFIGKKELISE